MPLKIARIYLHNDFYAPRRNTTRPIYFHAVIYIIRTSTVICSDDIYIYMYFYAVISTLERHGTATVDEARAPTVFKSQNNYIILSLPFTEIFPSVHFQDQPKVILSFKAQQFCTDLTVIHYLYSMPRGYRSRQRATHEIMILFYFICVLGLASGYNTIILNSVSEVLCQKGRFHLVTVS